jgi:hypothetical protein
MLLRHTAGGIARGAAARGQPASLPASRQLPRRHIRTRVAAVEEAASQQPVPAAAAPVHQQEPVAQLAVFEQLDELELAELDAAAEDALAWLVSTNEEAQEADLDEMVDYDEFGDDEYAELHAQVEQLLETAHSDLRIGDRVVGTVYQVDEEGAYVEIGQKASGFVPLAECSFAKLKSVRCRGPGQGLRHCAWCHKIGSPGFEPLQHAPPPPVAARIAAAGGGACGHAPRVHRRRPGGRVRPDCLEPGGHGGARCGLLAHAPRLHTSQQRHCAQKMHAWCLRSTQATVFWQRIRQFHEEQVVVSVRVESANKGGLLVKYGPYEGFVPVSQFGAVRARVKGVARSLGESICFTCTDQCASLEPLAVWRAQLRAGHHAGRHGGAGGPEHCRHLPGGGRGACVSAARGCVCVRTMHA